MKNHRFFNRKICADAQIRKFLAACRVSVKNQDFLHGEFVLLPKFMGYGRMEVSYGN